MSVRDLQFRSRRFVIAVLVTALVFSIALAFDGLRRTAASESPAIVAAFGADHWVVAEGAGGPFTTTRVLAASTQDAIRQQSGVTQADAVVLSRTVISSDPPKDANLVGHVPGGLGSPVISEGRAAAAPGEAVVSESAAVEVGERLVIGGKPFDIVGLSASGTYFFGTPSVFVSLADAQDIVFDGQPFAMGVAVTGTPTAAAGTTVVTNAQVKTDLDRPLAAALQSLVVMAVLMWLIAAGIIGLIVYLSAIERARDFAVFKATGAPTRIIVGGLMLQAVMVALAAAVLSVGLSRLVARAMPIESGLSGASISQLVVISLVVGVLASLAGVRSALRTDPAVAFGGK